MKINNINTLNKKTVFVYRNIKASNNYKTDPTIDPTADPSMVTVRTILSTLEIVFQK